MFDKISLDSLWYIRNNVNKNKSKAIRKVVITIFYYDL